MASGAEATVVAGVSATGALGIGMTAIRLIFAQLVTSRTILLQITAGVQILVEGPTRQRFELFVAVNDVRMLLLRLGRHIEQLFDVAVANAEREHLQKIVKI